MLAPFLFIVALLFLPDSAQGKDIYRWTDESGATHYADKVPQKYRGVARKIASDVAASGADRASAGGGKGHSAPVISRYPASTGDAAPLGPGNEVSSGSSGTSGAEGSSEDCASLRRQYWASQACFQQFRNANGSVKSEAFRHCREVQSPVAQCGPLITEP